MPVFDIQAWADYTEDTTLPGLSSQATVFSNRLDQYSAELTAVGNIATRADDDATEALSLLGSLEVALKAYTDAAVQTRLNGISGDLGTLQATIEANVRNSILADFNGSISSIQANNLNAQAIIEANQTQIDTIIAGYNTAVNDLLNAGIPALESDILLANTTASGANDNFDLFLGSYTFATLVEGLDAVRSESYVYADDAVNSAVAGFSTTYYTKAQTNNEISVAIAAYNSTVSSQITTQINGAIPGITTDIMASVSTSYYTKTYVDNLDSSLSGAIAAAEERVTAKLGMGSIRGILGTTLDAFDDEPGIFVSENAGGWIQITETSASTRNSGGATTGVQIPIDGVLAAGFSERRIRISVEVMKNTSGSQNFAMAYSTNDVGNSGIQEFTANDEWSWYDFYYDCPKKTTDSTDWIGIWTDESGGTIWARGVIVEIVSAEVVTQATAIANLGGYSAATYKIGLKAGGAANELAFYAIDDPILGTSSAVVFNSDTVTFDGDVIITGTLTTGKHEDDSITVYGQDFRSTVLNGTGAWVGAANVYMYYPFDTEVLVTFNADQSFNGVQDWDFRLSVAGSLVMSNNGEAIQDTPTLTWGGVVPAGWRNIFVEWNGANTTNISLAARSLVVMGRYK